MKKNTTTQEDGTMKNKNLYLVLLIALAMVSSVFAQPRDPIARGMDNYLAALESKNNGLVESAIVNIIKLKMTYPQLDYSKITAKLGQLVQATSDQAIRYEAYIAWQYLEYPERFNWLQTSNNQQRDILLTNLVVRIHEQTE
jgi:hypothetical protein